MPRPPRIAIIGGGIGGLAAALALERRGAEVVVYEQSRRMSEIGAGLNLTPNAVKAFRALGLEDRRSRRSASETRIFSIIRSWKSGRYISRTQPRRFPPKVRRAQSLRAPRRPARRVGRGAQDDATPPRRPLRRRRERRAARHGALCRRQHDRGRCRGRRRRHSFGGARKPVRRRQAALHRLHLLARHGAGRRRAGRHRHQERHHVDGPARPCRALPGAPRRASQHRRPCRQRRLDRGILDAANATWPK